jgi:hypothetical protein
MARACGCVPAMPHSPWLPWSAPFWRLPHDPTYASKPDLTSTQVNTPLNNPGPFTEGDLTELEVTDPTHPLFGRRFPVLSSRPQSPTATHVFVTYQGFMVLRLPRTATNLLPQLPRDSTTLTSHAITDFIALAEPCEVLCRTSPEPSGSPSVPHSKPLSTPSSRLSSRR